VRALRGCLDRLPERQSDALILRYGIGPLHAQRPREAAHALDVSMTRFGLIHRRGLRNLVRQARLTPCENTPVAGETLSSAYAEAWQAMASVGQVAGAQREGGDGRVAVLGVSRSDRGEDDGDSDDRSGGTKQPALSTFFGGLGPGTDSPWFIALSAIMLAGTLWIIHAFVRALR
jgi:hypothetical protein